MGVLPPQQVAGPGTTTPNVPGLDLSYKCNTLYAASSGHATELTSVLPRYGQQCKDKIITASGSCIGDEDLTSTSPFYNGKATRSWMEFGTASNASEVTAIVGADGIAKAADAQTNCSSADLTQTITAPSSFLVTQASCTWNAACGAANNATNNLGLAEGPITSPFSGSIKNETVGDCSATGVTLTAGLCPAYGNVAAHDPTAVTEATCVWKNVALETTGDCPAANGSGSPTVTKGTCTIATPDVWVSDADGCDNASEFATVSNGGTCTKDGVAGVWVSNDTECDETDSSEDAYNYTEVTDGGKCTVSNDTDVGTGSECVGDFVATEGTCTKEGVTGSGALNEVCTGPGIDLLASKATKGTCTWANLEVVTPTVTCEYNTLPGGTGTVVDFDKKEKCVAKVSGFFLDNTSNSDVCVPIRQTGGTGTGTGTSATSAFLAEKGKCVWNDITRATTTAAAASGGIGLATSDFTPADPADAICAVKFNQ